MFSVRSSAWGLARVSASENAAQCGSGPTGPLSPSQPQFPWPSLYTVNLTLPFSLPPGDLVHIHGLNSYSTQSSVQTPWPSHVPESQIRGTCQHLLFSRSPPLQNRLASLRILLASNAQGRHLPASLTQTCPTFHLSVTLMATISCWVTATASLLVFLLLPWPPTTQPPSRILRDPLNYDTPLPQPSNGF